VEIRLRQVALVASDRDAVIAELGAFLAVSACFADDPGVVESGLHNAIMTIGDQFLEVVSPTASGTAAGRLLERRGGDSGYMAIFEVDDLDQRGSQLDKLGVCTIFNVDLPDMRALHLHPRDVGGTIVSIEQPEPFGTWRWAGPWTRTPRPPS
jgi:hypothetical protein